MKSDHKYLFSLSGLREHPPWRQARSIVLAGQRLGPSTSGALSKAARQRQTEREWRAELGQCWRAGEQQGEAGEMGGEIHDYHELDSDTWAPDANALGSELGYVEPHNLAAARSAHLQAKPDKRRQI